MKNFLSLFASILMSALIAVWFSQNPINAYWQQTYHRNSPLEPLAAYGWWRSGVALQENAYALSDGTKPSCPAKRRRRLKTAVRQICRLKPPHQKPSLKPVKQNGNKTPKPPPSAAATKSFLPATR